MFTRLTTGEFRSRRAYSAGVESDDVEVRDQFRIERAVRNVSDELHAAAARASRVHEQVTDPFVRRCSPVNIDRDIDGACVGVPVVRGDLDVSALDPGGPARAPVDGLA